MTGSINLYQRQHSSTATSSNVEKPHPVKLRRCSSADDHNAPEIVLDDGVQKEKFSSQRKRTNTNEDSGTEEAEQSVFAACDVKKEGANDTVGPANVDEGFSESEPDEKPKVFDIEDDLDSAKEIPDEMKKDFCQDTTEAFHGEFARLISVPLALYYGARFYLFAADELYYGHSFDLTGESFLKLDNAKAQFKCPNPFCGHAWTSMRARIAFNVFGPNPGYVILRILGQDCQRCCTHTDAVWYIDEVCRVMKNLTRFIFETYYPNMLSIIDCQAKPIPEPSRSRHDPSQRKGNMLAPHVKEFCEACRLNMCYI